MDWWYVSISTVLKEHGWRRLKSVPCCWLLIDPSLVNAETTHRVMTRSGGQVDAFVFVGNEGNKVWETARKQLQDHFRSEMWGIYKAKSEWNTKKTEVFS